MSEHPHPHDDHSFAESPTQATVQDPPTSIIGIVKRLGPGLIIAGSIVGSGELIATTKVGAEAGFYLLWLIIIGCVIKVFTQVEFGRYSIVIGKTTVEGLNEVPGPRLKVNWITWYWLVMFLVSLGQLGGIVGVVGQTLAISAPLTAQGRAFNEYQDLLIDHQVIDAIRARAQRELDAGRAADAVKMQKHIKELSAREAELARQLDGKTAPPEGHDSVIWAAIITVITAAVLVIGRYTLIQTIATLLVALFTFITIGNLVHLQSLADWRVQWPDVWRGLRFGLPPTVEGSKLTPVATALAAFGIIGVGATELIQYPYWCLEKGYARWTGPRDDSPEWAARARGWLRVLRWDAWASMVVYTFATLAFYLLGAAVLGRTHLIPADDTHVVRTLSEMYTPVFGPWAQGIFLFGAFAVLYSTFFVANAGHARVCADAVRVFGLSAGGQKAVDFWTRVFSGVFPFICLIVYWQVKAPVALVLTSGLMQAIMLPMLAGAALYFRYRRADPRLRPTSLWDVCLWLSGLGLLISGGWAAWNTLIAAAKYVGLI